MPFKQHANPYCQSGKHEARVGYCKICQAHYCEGCESHTDCRYWVIGTGAYAYMWTHKWCSVYLAAFRYKDNGFENLYVTFNIYVTRNNYVVLELTVLSLPGCNSGHTESRECVNVKCCCQWACTYCTAAGITYSKTYSLVQTSDASPYGCAAYTSKLVEFINLLLCM